MQEKDASRSQQEHECGDPVISVSVIGQQSPLSLWVSRPSWYSLVLVLEGNSLMAVT